LPRSSGRAALFAVGLAVLFFWLHAPVARACPPGHYQIGGGTAGWVGCAPMDGGVGAGNSAPSIEDMNITAPGLSNYDARAWAEFFEHMGQQQIELERSQVKPEHREIYEELLKGLWIYGDSKPGAAVPMCMASFHARRGGLMFLDWGGSEPGTMFAFFGNGIPRVGRVKRVRVQLIQSGQTQTVEAFHTAYPILRNMGMTMMRVPSTEALLSSIEDRQDFEFKMDEADLITGRGIGGALKGNRPPTGRYHRIWKETWHSGHEAREKLRACIQRREGR
jgi:hypothetical protein